MSRLIKFEQERCVPCKMVGNYLDDKGIKYDPIDIAEEFVLTDKFGIMSTPVTILLDDNDEEVQRVVGFNPAQLDELISKL